jgi:hypothetical protein
MKSAFLCFWILSCTTLATAQTYHLSEGLSEISGIDFLNDTTIIALNDGGNEPLLFLLDLQGKIQRIIKVENATNVDWEDITVDDDFVYIGDIGNNLNNRKDLVIYKVKIDDIHKNKSVQAEKINFNYTEQTAFPPDKTGLFFDCEALAVANDTLYLFTKNRAKSTDGNSFVYQLPTTPGAYSVSKFAEIYIGKGGMLVDALTAADSVDDEFFLMTYNRVIIKKRVNGKFVGEENINFKTYSQKEALVVKSKLEIYVADEKQLLLGGPRLYHIDVNDIRDED